MTKMPPLIATTAPFSVKLTTTHVDPWRSNTYARLFSLSPTTRWSPSMATAEPNASVECAGDCTGACSVDSSVQVEVALPGTTRTYTFTAGRDHPVRNANHHGVAAYGDSRARAVSDRERIREDFLDNGDAGLICGDRFVRVRRENIRRAGVGGRCRHARVRVRYRQSLPVVVVRHVPAEIVQSTAFAISTSRSVRTRRHRDARVCIPTRFQSWC